jgi:nucleoside-diphosphate-sugar epimerase
MKALVTGANGFVGRAVLRRLNAMSGIQAKGSVRRADATTDTGASVVVTGDLSPQTDWSASLTGADVVIHAAARVHVMDETAVDPLAEFRRVNVDGTLNLALQAAAMGTKRFVFLSSIGVNGAQSILDKPFSEADNPAPCNAYALSKWNAEKGLQGVASDTGLEVVIIRPPLVYGPNPPGNFRRLLRLAARGWPLPLGAIHNKRSFAALDNLVDLIVTCIDHPAAANQTFLVSDGEDISTTELLRRMGAALGKPARLLPVPVWILAAGAALLGKGDLSQRLCGNLQVDISKAKDLLGWSPLVSVNEGLRVTAEHYLATL